MYLVIFVLIAALGSFLAWRRNPMYSAASSLRVGLAVLLMIAAMIGVIALTVRFAVTKSQPVALTLIFAAVAIATTGLILGIMKLTLPKAPPTPSSVARLTLHRRRLTPWATCWAAAVLALGALALALPAREETVAFAWAGIVAIPGLIVLGCCYYAARNQDLALTALEYQPWVHWRYAPTAWHAWTEAQAARANATPQTIHLRRTWWKIALVALSIGLGGALMGVPAAVSACFALGVFLLTCVAFLAGNSSQAHAGQALRARLSRCAPEVYFGEEGLFSAGVLTPWISVNDWLLDAAVEDSTPRGLVFRFEKINAGNAAAPSTTLVQRVLVPPNATSDLARLQTELKHRCPQARINLS